MIEVTNEVPVLEIDGESLTYPPAAEGLLDKSHWLLTVKSHWSDDDLVVMTYGCTTITVCAGELKAAIKNATNTERF